MKCEHHGKTETEKGYQFKMCELTGLPCPHHGVMTFHEVSFVQKGPCRFVEELFKIDPELTVEMASVPVDPDVE